MVDKNARNRIYRKFKKIRSAVEILRDNSKMNEQQATHWLGECESLYNEWKADLREKRRPFHKKSGRPTREQTMPHHEVCKKRGCMLKPPPGQAYCTQEHAPLYSFGKNWK